MENEAPERQKLVTVLAVVWCLAVAVSYYSFNVAYYIEKVSTFGRFFLTLMGM